ncbi:MAG TPA: phosphate ABC transporter substrate-binding protein PstS [Candidatus Aquilonibacter sp.]|nr:phosphate ABC transporter substrate-binding protein PstS [Candidatus Aquilonibacter sp.]
MLRKLHLSVALISVALIALLFTACNKKSSSESAGSNPAIIGAGSTFIFPIMTRWISAFQGNHQGVQINYQSIGSGGGIQQLKKGLIDFGASDAALDDQQLKEMQPVIQIPESAGPVCITYNLPELKEPLKLSASTLSGIFLGKIKTWQDAEIKKDNPGVKLPNHAILVAHRSDGSGTTNIFTTYLTKVSPEWASKVGKGISVNWPTGIGGKGSEGVTGVVRQAPGSIGYTELNYAEDNNLPVALIRNQAGVWVAPSTAGTTAAIAAFHDELAEDVRNPIVDPPASAKDAYPICGLTYLLVPKDGQDVAKRQAVKNFIDYIITNGQSFSDGLYYAQLPPTLIDQDQKLLGEMLAAGQPLHNSATTTSASR